MTDLNKKIEEWKEQAGRSFLSFSGTEFCRASRKVVPALIAEVERLREENEFLKTENDHTWTRAKFETAAARNEKIPQPIETAPKGVTVLVYSPKALWHMDRYGEDGWGDEGVTHWLPAPPEPEVK